ncbi:MAG: endonuclease IV [Paracoccaceae bacterium]|mgnify:CR=1 FL=1|jgi:hypothetical protein
MSKKAFELGKKVSLHKSYLINGRAEKKRAYKNGGAAHFYWMISVYISRIVAGHA